MIVEDRLQGIDLEDKNNPVVDKAEADMQLMSKVKDKQPIEGDKEMLYDMLLKGVGLWDKEKLDNMLKEAGLWNKEMVLDSQKVVGEKLHVVELLNMDMIQELVLHMEGLIEHGLLLAYWHLHSALLVELLLHACPSSSEVAKQYHQIPVREPSVVEPFRSLSNHLN